MMMRNLAFLLLALVLAGCTDTADTVTREYRNTINEAIDAMMMTSSEKQAEAVTVRVFKPLRSRFMDIDKHLKTIQLNRKTNKELVEEFLESDSVHLYLSELQINRQRYTLELTRLRHLMKKYVERERELRIKAGDKEADIVINERELSKHLSEMIYGDSLTALRDHLEKSPIMELMATFPDKMKAEKSYAKTYDRFVARRKNFAPKEFKLVD